VRFLFDCGGMANEQLAAVSLQAEEIAAHRLVEVSTALGLLSGPLRRRVSAALGAERCVYLEEGRPVSGVD
jgi:8-oxo-dGTP diphosphatase